MEKWPNFFIVGASKAGTTSLYEYLKDIPEIYMSPLKEPNYFNRQTIHEEHPVYKIRTKEKYLKLFSKSKNQKILGEASGYLQDPDAPKLIHQISPDAKILISIRDPVERAFSHYLMLVAEGSTTSFRQEIEYEFHHGNNPKQRGILLESGFYSKHIKKYWNFFGPKQVKIIIFEEFVKNPKTTLEEILDFLGFNNYKLNFELNIHNPYKSPRGHLAIQILKNEKIRKLSHKLIPLSIRRFIGRDVLAVKKPKPSMSDEDRNSLIKYYKNDVLKLEKILGRKLPWKNFNNDFPN